MFRYTGGETTRHGFYWNARTWSINLIERQGGVLPGDTQDRYARIPVLVMLLAAPVMGAAYVIFLPFIGFAMVIDFVARRVGRAVRDGAVAFAAVVSPRWRPGEAYLAKDEKHEQDEQDEGTDGDARQGE